MSNTRAARPDGAGNSGLRARKPSPGRYGEQYGVIVVCDGERHQQQIYERLKRDGLKCRVVVT